MARGDAVAPRRSATEVVATGVVVLMVVVPLAAVLWRSVHVDGALSAAALERVLGSARTWRVVALTIGQAVVSAAVTLAVGVPVAWVLTRRRFVGAKVVRTAAMVPFVLPSVVVGAAFATVLGPRGVVDLRGTWWAVLVAHACFNLAVVIRVVGSALATPDSSAEDAARMAGLSPVAVFSRVTLPSIAPAVWSAAVLTGLFCLTSFGVIVVLGGGPVTTIEVEMWTRATRQFDLSGAAVLAGVQAVIVVAALCIPAPAAHRGSARARTERVTPCHGWGDRVAVGAAVAVVLLLSVVPLLAVAVRSFEVGDSWGLAHWRALLAGGEGANRVDPGAAVLTSLRAAVPAAVAAVALGVPAAVASARRPSGTSERLLLLPVAVSATTIGLGLLLVAGRPPLDLRRSPALVVIAQLLVAVPLVVRTVAPAVAATPTSVLDAAALGGAGPTRRWWAVQFPLVRPAVLAGAGLAFVAALGEFGATVFVARTGSPTMPIAIERLLSRPAGAGLGQAMAMSCLLVVLCGVVLAVIDHLPGAERHSL